MKRGARTPEKSAGFTISALRQQGYLRSAARRQTTGMTAGPGFGQNGFTIVETMIVLAVTGVLFAAIVGTWSGRQHQNEFTTAAQEVRSRLQQVVGDVQAGYFPGNANFNCSAADAGLMLSGASSTAQGQNSACVFLGKVVQFAMANTDPEQYLTYSVAGLSNPSDLTDITTAKPTALAADGSAATSGMPDLSETNKQLYGMTTVAMKVNDHGTMRDVGAVGFLSRMGSLGSSGGFNSGAQQIDLYALETNLNAYGSSTDAARAINAHLQNSNGFVVNQPVSICFKSGGTNQYALVTIGSNNQNLNVDLKIMTTANCNL